MDLNYVFAKADDGSGEGVVLGSMRVKDVWLSFETITIEFIKSVVFNIQSSSNTKIPNRTPQHSVVY